MKKKQKLMSLLEKQMVVKTILDEHFPDGYAFVCKAKNEDDTKVVCRLTRGADTDVLGLIEFHLTMIKKEIQEVD